MKKFAIFILVLGVNFFGVTSAFSEDQDYMEPRGGREQQGMMGGKGAPPASMVALMDGSVVVLSGHKLTKYDSDLNLVKEASIQGGGMSMDKKERVKRPRIIDEDFVQEPPAELSDSVPAMLEAAATPPTYEVGPGIPEGE